MFRLTLVVGRLDYDGLHENISIQILPKVFPKGFTCVYFSRDTEKTTNRMYSTSSWFITSLEYKKFNFVAEVIQLLSNSDRLSKHNANLD